MSFLEGNCTMAEEKKAPESPESTPSRGQQEQKPSAEQVEAKPAGEAPPPGKDARMWAMFCHLGGLAGCVFPFGNIILPLIFWQIKKDEFPFVDQQGKEAVNFQISMSLYALVGALVCAVTCIGTVLIPFIVGAVAIVDLVFLLIAAVKANNGEAYRYPLCIRFIK
jgi:uncharacterized Tic20 family protein